jgi:hypothetical protein
LNSVQLNSILRGRLINPVGEQNANENAVRQTKSIENCPDSDRVLSSVLLNSVSPARCLTL